jgi:hypothetical protein
MGEFTKLGMHSSVEAKNCKEPITLRVGGMAEMSCQRRGEGDNDYCKGSELKTTPQWLAQQTAARKYSARRALCINHP